MGLGDLFGGILDAGGDILGGLLGGGGGASGGSGGGGSILGPNPLGTLMTGGQLGLNILGAMQDQDRLDRADALSAERLAEEKRQFDINTELARERLAQAGAAAGSEAAAGVCRRTAAGSAARLAAAHAGPSSPSARPWAARAGCSGCPSRAR